MLADAGVLFILAGMYLAAVSLAWQGAVRLWVAGAVRRRWYPLIRLLCSETGASEFAWEPVAALLGAMVALKLFASPTGEPNSVEMRWSLLLVQCAVCCRLSWFGCAASGIPGVGSAGSLEMIAVGPAAF